MEYPAPPTRTDWSRVALIFAAGVGAACQVGKVPPSLPQLRADLGLTLFAAGWVISLLNLLAASGGVLAGSFSDRLGHRRVALGGLALMAAASLAGGFAHDLAELLLTRFFEGAGYIVVAVTGPSLILRVTNPRHTKLAFGLWACFMPAGTSLMMVLSPLLLDTYGWRSLWWANAMLVAVVALALARTTRGLGPVGTQTGKDRSSALGDLRMTLGRPGPVLLALCFGAYALQFMGVAGFLPTLLMEDMGLTKALAATLSALVVFLNVPGNLLGGWLLHRRVSRTALLVTASGVMGLCAMGLYSVHLSGPVRYGLCLVFTGVGGMVPASLFGAAPRHAPSPALLATTNGLMLQGGNLGSTLGPPTVAAVVAASGSWQGAPWLLVPVALCGGVFALLLGWLERSSGTVPAEETLRGSVEVLPQDE